MARRGPRSSSSLFSLFARRFTLSGPLAVLAILIMGAAHVAVELYKDFYPVLPAPKEMQVCFTPGKGCQSLIIRQINTALKTIHIQAFSFTDPDIGAALIKAKNRGVLIRAILDQSNKTNKKSLASLLIRNHVAVRIDAPAGIAHNKVMIIDEHTVITGSYNFSTGAYLRNAENLIVLNDPVIATSYLNNWVERWKKSVRLK